MSRKISGHVVEEAMKQARFARFNEPNAPVTRKQLAESVMVVCEEMERIRAGVIELQHRQMAMSKALQMLGVSVPSLIDLLIAKGIFTKEELDAQLELNVAKVRAAMEEKDSTDGLRDNGSGAATSGSGPTGEEQSPSGQGVSSSEGQEAVRTASEQDATGEGDSVRGETG